MASGLSRGSWYSAHKAAAGCRSNGLIIQAMPFVQPCGHGLVEAAMLGLGIPVGHVDEFFLGMAEAAQTAGQHGRAGQGFEEFGSLHHGGSPKV